MDECIAAAVLIVGIILGAVFGSYCERSEIRAQAIKHRVAHYEASEDGTAEFVWNEPVKP